MSSLNKMLSCRIEFHGNWLKWQSRFTEGCKRTSTDNYRISRLICTESVKGDFHKTPLSSCECRENVAVRTVPRIITYLLSVISTCTARFGWTIRRHLRIVRFCEHQCYEGYPFFTDVNEILNLIFLDILHVLCCRLIMSSVMFIPTNCTNIT
jgi:hypothetical protein